MMEIEDKNFCNGYALGTVMFDRMGLPEIVWAQECGTLHVGEQCCDADGEIAVWQKLDNGKLEDGIKLHPALDISDARRIAGIIMAWADRSEAENEKESNERHKIGEERFLEGYPDPVTLTDYTYMSGEKIYRVKFKDGSTDFVKEIELKEGV